MHINGCTWSKSSCKNMKVQMKNGPIRHNDAILNT
jgi:hypothetical protein